MKRFIPEEVAKSIMTIKNFCSQFEDCPGCPLFIEKYEVCALGDIIPDETFEDVKTEQSYFIEVDDNE